MDRLTEIEAFVRVVDLGGFTDAAKKMGVSKSAVSKHVAALEDRLGARLLNRTTRRVNPTEIGLAYYDRAIRVLSEATEADEMVTAMQETPRGELRVSAPTSFGIRTLAPAIAEFLKQYEDISVHLVFDDRFVELVAEGYDMAIRIGDLPDSTLRARKLADAQVKLIAAPAYLEAHGEPVTIADLSTHNLLHYSNLSSGNFWRLLTPTGQERQVRAVGRLTVNNGDALLTACESGLGIAFLPDFIVDASLERGAVVELMEHARRPPLGIFAVYPQGRYTQPKLRAFIDFLAEMMKKNGAES